MPKSLAQTLPSNSQAPIEYYGFRHYGILFSDKAEDREVIKAALLRDSNLRDGVRAARELPSSETEALILELKSSCQALSPKSQVRTYVRITDGAYVDAKDNRLKTVDYGVVISSPKLAQYREPSEVDASTSRAMSESCAQTYDGYLHNQWVCEGGVHVMLYESAMTSAPLTVEQARELFHKRIQARIERVKRFPELLAQFDQVEQCIAEAKEKSDAARATMQQEVDSLVR